MKLWKHKLEEQIQYKENKNTKYILIVHGEFCVSVLFEHYSENVSDSQIKGIAKLLSQYFAT